MIVSRCRRRLTGLVAGIRHALRACLWARPAAATHAAGTAGDLRRSRAQLLAENAFLRQQLLVLHRSIKRRGVPPGVRPLLVRPPAGARAGGPPPPPARPEPLRRGHRGGSRAFGGGPPRRGRAPPPLPAE